MGVAASSDEKEKEEIWTRKRRNKYCTEYDKKGQMARTTGSLCPLQIFRLYNDKEIFAASVFSFRFDNTIRL